MIAIIRFDSYPICDRKPGLILIPLKGEGLSESTHPLSED